MKSKFLCLLFVLSLAGCFGSPTKIALVSDDDLKYVGTIELCAAYGDKLFGMERVKKELMARNRLHQQMPGSLITVHKHQSGNPVVVLQQESGVEMNLPEKGTLSDKTDTNGGVNNRSLKKKIAEHLPPDSWEWELIEKGEIKEGMTQCGLLASWGKPVQIVKSSRSVDEWIYQGFVKYGSVHIRKGKIKKWVK